LPLFLFLFLSLSGALQKELYRREWRAAAASWASGVDGSSREEKREREREREKEEY
jgi:hypothetical protein